MLRYVTLRYVTLRYVILYYIVLYYIILYYIILYYIILYYIIYNPFLKLQYEIYHCFVYSTRLLMIDRGTVRNM